MTSVTISTINTVGVYLSPGYANSLTITSSGGIEPTKLYGFGALDVDYQTTLVRVVNHGTIEGYRYYPTFSQEGVALFSPTSLTNTGEIAGGYGGSLSGTGGIGGDGVYISELYSSIHTASTVVNSGVIGGGRGGFGFGSQGQGGNGGVGVNIETRNASAALLNSGTVIGGAGGESDYTGGGGAPVAAA